MEMRKTVPGPDNKYYLRIPAGWNPCILGNPNNRLYPQSVLSNCIGGSVGRFNELQQRGNCGQLGNAQPGYLLTLARNQGLEIWQSPAVGGVIVLLKADGMSGHVISVEKIRGGFITTFESGWNYAKGTFCRNRTITKAGNYGMSREYHFAGCIVNPAVDPYSFTMNYVNKWHRRGEGVKAVQWVLRKEGCYAPGANSNIDGSCGPSTQAAIRNFQKKHGLAVDGSAGPATQAVMKKLYSIE